MQQKIHVLSRGVTIKDAHILLCYDPRSAPNHYYEFSKYFYYLPGGHIEFQENATEAVIREIVEETGHIASIDRFLGTIENFWKFEGDEVCCHTHEVNLVFKMNIDSLNHGDEIAQRESHVAFKWISLNELAEIDLRPSILKTLLPIWLEQDYNQAFAANIGL